MSKCTSLTLFTACVLCAAASAAGVLETATVTDVVIRHSAIIQGEPLWVSFRVRGGGEKLSATTFVRRGAIDEPPAKWHEGALRFEPKYQITRRDMRGKTVRVQCALPGRLTREMPQGVHTLFVAIHNSPSGWDTVKLGEFRVSPFDRIDVPERSGPPRVAIWQDGAQIDGAVSSPVRLAALTKQAGCVCTLLGRDQIADEAIFNRDRFDLLILPYGGTFPSAATENIAAFLRRAGAILSVGGAGLVAADSPSSGGNSAPRMLMDAEADASLASLSVERGPKTEGIIERVPEGAAGTGHALRLSVPQLKDWCYVAIPLDQTGGGQEGVIRFWAKGDANTSNLCLEFNEDDGSRWKYFVALSTDWLPYSVRMRDFAVYASPARGGLTDRCQPGRVVRLKLGFYRALFDDEVPRSVWIDEVERHATGGERLESRAQHLARWAAQYAYLKARPPAYGLGLVKEVRRVKGITRIAAAPGQHVIDPATELTGAFAGWDVTPITALQSDGRWASGVTRCAGSVPLLEGFDAQGRRLGALAGLLFNYRGPYRGSSCALFCVDSEDLFASDRPAMAQVFVDVVRKLTSPAYVFDVEPTFSEEDGRLRQTWRASVANPSARSQRLTLRARPIHGDGEQTESLTLGRGRVRQLALALDAEVSDLARLGARVSLLRDGMTIDEVDTRVSALAALTAAGDWLLANQKAEGQFSKYYYADTYGARALRVLGRLTGKIKYTEAGLRIVDVLVRTQRPDGGWWVGYGAPGECVFVADDGCIALALVQLAPYVGVERRRTYLHAVGKFIKFRESFRITDEVAKRLEARYGKEHRGILRGGLGVGYVRTDYFAKTRYPEVRREMRQFPWTLHCSLAFLGGLYALTQEAEHRRLAVQDTKWFLERIAEGKDSVTNPYANEAAVWMLRTLDRADLREQLEAQLKGHFLPYVATTDAAWWTRSGGRGALLLPGLVHCSRHVDSSPKVQAALARVLWSLCADTSPLSIQSIVRQYPHTTNGEIVMYVCFSALGLAEFLDPGSTMLPSG